MATFKSVKINRRCNTYQLTFYTPTGERRRISAGRDEAYARRLAVKFDDWLMEGKDPEREMEKLRVSESAKSITVHDFYPIFLRRHGSTRSHSMQISYGVSFRNVLRCDPVANCPLQSLSRRLVQDYLQLRINEGVTNATVNKELAFLKCMVSRAVDWGIIDNNALKGIHRLPESGRRDVFLTPEEAVLLIKELPEPVASIVEFAIYSGFRRENILGLKIESIRFHNDAKTGEVELVVKGGRLELFPLGKSAVKVLKRAIGTRKSGYVFINPVTKSRYTTITKTYDRAVKRLGLTISNGTKLRFHDLRHVFATWLHRSGVSLDSLRSLLGHRDRATTDRYAAIDRLETGKCLGLMPDLRKL